MKRFLSILMIFALLFTTLYGCDGKGEEETTDLVGNESENSAKVLSLAYSKSDLLNPFYCESEVNSQITLLVFDGLFKLDKHYEPQPNIAKSSVVASSMVNVTLSECIFSDGSPVTVGDVVSSFEQAKESPVYKARLKNILSINTGSETSVIFNLETPDPYALSCLDFPIVKFGSDLELPIGTGRYVYKKEGERVVLLANRNKAGFDPTYRTIMLEPIHDADSIESSLVIGNTAFSYDELTDGTYRRINAKTIDVGINSLVYLGFNCSDSFLWDPRVRLAVSLAIDTQELVQTAFQSHARATATVFNPDWYEVKDFAASKTFDIEKSKKLLEESGINPKSREITILYYGENGFKTETAEYIEQCLENIGFVVRLKGYSKEDYMYDLENGIFDMYIGEIKLTKNMNLDPLFSGRANYGVDVVGESAMRYGAMKMGNCEMADFLNTFATDMPFMPLCYRNACVSYTKAMKADFTAYDSDVFYDIESWSIQ